MARNRADLLVGERLHQHAQRVALAMRIRIQKNNDPVSRPRPVRVAARALCRDFPGATRRTRGSFAAIGFHFRRGLIVRAIIDNDTSNSPA